MSLDVYLETEEKVKTSGIFVRDNGSTKQISLEEWKERHPDRDPVYIENYEDEIYHANITHNLVEIADKAGIYKELWRPEEVGITTACQLIEPLAVGLEKLRSDPEYYRQFNPDNGWGTYEGFVEFVLNYLIACLKNPDAKVEVCR